MSTAPAPTQASAREQHSEFSGHRYAIFRRGEQLFGLTIDLVREVLPGQSLTRVPRASAQMAGVLSLRGEILPVVLVDEWLGLPSQADNAQQPILVLRHAELLVGLRVDSIQMVIPVPASQVQPHPGGEAGSLLQGLWQPAGQAAITLIDGPTLLDTLCHQANDL